MKKKYIWAGIGASVLLMLLCLAIWAVPLIQTAFLLGDVSEFEYELSVDLEEKNLTEQQKQLVDILSLILTGGENSALSWEIDGRVSDGTAFGQIYCKGRKEPVTEVYFQQEEGYLNVEMLYNTIRDNVLEQHPLLGRAVPEWGYGAFLSTAQVEEMFHVDLKDLFQSEELTENQKNSPLELFRIFLGMKRKRGADGQRQFEIELENYRILLEPGKEKDRPAVRVKASDQSEGQAAAVYNGKFVFGDTEKVTVPDDRMTDRDVQQYARLWEGISSIQELFQ